MNVFKIAWRSLQHRGLGSLLTIISMALGVMMVVAVLSIHGVVSKSFKSNNSFGYNIVVGARGGGMQLTLNSVYYLSNPVENIPYEYYLAFCDQETRRAEMQHSFAAKSLDLELDVMEAIGQLLPGGAGLGGVSTDLTQKCHNAFSVDEMMIEKKGVYRKYTDSAIPLCLGDFWEAGEGVDFRCVGTKPKFFEKLVLDIDTEEKFQFAEGRCFKEFDEQNGFFECVVGSTVAKRGNLKVGDKIQATHGDPDSQNAHIHEQRFTVVGILESTGGTPHDRAVYLNMEGFYLMEDHAKPVVDDSMLDTDEEEGDDSASLAELDPFAFEESQEAEEIDGQQAAESDTEEADASNKADLYRIPLPIEQREVTSFLVRTSRNDPYGLLPHFLPPQINEGDLETTLGWSAYRPVKSQKAVQAVNPIDEVTNLFMLFVDPVRWLLLALTIMICLVSAISILVGIYNSMSQRQQEIAVMRALGANRLKVMSIMMIEAILLASLGGAIGWLAGHGLNAAVSPVVEARTGVQLGFFDIAPGVPLLGYVFGSSGFLPDWLVRLPISPELLLIPGLIALAILVGTYPAISAYRTDVANSLGK